MGAAKLPPLPSSRKTAAKGTTAIGYVNRHDQTVIRRTDLQGNDHNQRVYVLRCTAGHEYGANGSDIHLRVCPYCKPEAGGRDLLVER
jgi:hypothetical protein